MKSIKIFFLTSLYFFPFFIVKANLVSDSLIASLPLKNDTIKVKHYFKIIERLKENRKALKWKCATRALEISDELSYNFGRAKAYEYMATLMYQDNKIVRSLEYNFRALDIYNQSKLSYKAVKVLIHIGMVFNHFGDTKTSKTYARYAIQKLSIHPNPKECKYEILNLIKLLSELKDEPDVKEIIATYRNLFEVNDNDLGLFTIYLSKYHLAKNEYKKALSLAQKALKISSKEAEEKPENYLKALENLGTTFLQIQKYDSAFYYLEQCRKLSGINKMLSLEYKSTRSLSNLLLKRNKFKQALAYAKQYNSIAKANKDGEEIKRSLYQLAKINSFTKSYKDSYNFILKYAKVNDSLAQLENSVVLNSLIYKRGLAESELLNKKLLDEIKKKDSIIRDKQVLQVGLIIGLLIIFIFTIFVIFLFVRHSINNNLLKSKTEEIIQKNETLELQNIMLEKLNSDKNGIIGVVSHDLKAPLNRIEGLLALVISDNEFNNEQTTYLSIAQKELVEAKEMIKKILDSELKGSDETKLKIEKLNLNSLLDEIVRNYQIMASNKYITIYSTYSEENIEINTDRNYLSRIVDNLLSNALKFSESNKNVFISVGSNQESIEIKIKDEGPGFTENDKKSIFKKYQKLSAQPTRGENSTGLGLHIVQMLINDLQGKIELESEPNKGSTFILRFLKTI